MSTTLLLADDSPTIRRVIELTFADEGVRVVTAEDGEEAIERIKADRPDIVLADIGMPKKSGYDVAAFIKQSPALASIPVLLLAGAFDPVDEERAERTGCDGVLVKPFEPRHLIDRVRDLLQGGTGGAELAAPSVPRPVNRLSPPLDLSSLDIPPSRPLRLVGTPSLPADADRSAQEMEDALGAAPAAGSTEGPPRSTAALDDYFDQLDSAFSSKAAWSKVSPPEVSRGGARPSGTTPSQTAHEGAPPESGAAPSDVPVADSRVPPSARPAEPSEEAVPPGIDDGLVGELASRVAGRIGPAAVGDAVRDAMKEVVADAVSELDATLAAHVANAVEMAGADTDIDTNADSDSDSDSDLESQRPAGESASDEAEREAEKRESSSPPEPAAPPDRTERDVESAEVPVGSSSGDPLKSAEVEAARAIGEAVLAAVRSAVADTVSEIAERLVREEIERLTRDLPSRAPEA